MKTLQKILTGLVLILFGAAVSFVVTYTELNESYSEKLSAIYSSAVVAKSAEVEEYIDTFFVGEADKTLMADAVGSAMVASTGDEWSYYISAEDFSLYQEQMNNEYVGIGVTITQAEDQSGFLVQEVTAGSPAEEAGIQVGDKLVKVSGKPISALDVSAVRDRVRGEEGTTVLLTMVRDGKELDFTVERRTIETVVAYGQLMEDGVGYVSIANFDMKCAEQTIAAIESVLEQGATSLLFDVRNNPGGYKSELVKVLDYLLPEGELFRMVSASGDETYVDMSDASCLEIPMAVLVNRESYSAAEFFAAALQEYDAAEIVGARTYGKGYYQMTYNLSDGSAIVLSSGTYFTPGGVSLAGVGITPDVEVPLDDADFLELYYNRLDPAEDEQLQAALELLR